MCRLFRRMRFKDTQSFDFALNGIDVKRLVSGFAVSLTGLAELLPTIGHVFDPQVLIQGESIQNRSNHL